MPKTIGGEIYNDNDPSLAGVPFRKIEVHAEEPLPQDLADLNERLHQIGRADAVVSTTSSPDQIERAKRIVLHSEASEGVYGDGNTPIKGEHRQRSIIGKIMELAGQQKAPGFLQKLLDTAAQKKSEAESAKGAADHALQTAIDRQNRYDQLRLDLGRANDDLTRARQFRENLEKEISAGESTEALANRWLRASGGPGSPYEALPTYARLMEVDSNRAASVRALADWKRVEPILTARVATIKAAIAKIEDESL
jgi:hypothetical protein